MVRDGICDIWTTLHAYINAAGTVLELQDAARLRGSGLTILTRS